MYTVALYTHHTAQTFAITVRDISRSPHWQITEMRNPVTVRDTREEEHKLFTVMANFDTEREAREFATVLSTAYVAHGWIKETVKVAVPSIGEVEYEVD